MTDEKAKEVALALSQNLILFHNLGASRFGADANNRKGCIRTWNV
jgi:hypothetical protein